MHSSYTCISIQALCKALTFPFSLTSSKLTYHIHIYVYVYKMYIKICVCVGGVSEHETLGNVECYDPETDRWVVDVIPQMRYRRSGVGVAVSQGLLFAIGGYLEGKTSTDAVECYNPRTKRYIVCIYMSIQSHNIAYSTCVFM